MKKEKRPAYRKPQGEQEDKRLSACLEDNLVEIRRQLGNSDDLLIHRHRAGQVEVAVVMFDGLVSRSATSSSAPLPAFRPRRIPAKGSTTTWGAAAC